MSAQASLDTVKKIIQAIRNTPGLYNYKHDDFLVAERREQCWQDVSNTVNLKVEDLKSRWRVLRDRYVRHQRKLQMGRIDRSQVRFPFFEQMKFLDPFIKRRNPKSLLGSSKNKALHENTIDNNNQLYKDENQDENTLMSLENAVHYNNELDEEYLVDETEKPGHNKNIYNIKGEFPSDTLFVESEFIGESTNQERRTSKRQQDNDLDEDDLFGKSLGMSLKKLSRLNNVRVKAEIYKVLQKYIESEEIE